MPHRAAAYLPCMLGLKRIVQQALLGKRQINILNIFDYSTMLHSIVFTILPSPCEKWLPLFVLDLINSRNWYL
jgi:hypothetical protein